MEKPFKLRHRAFHNECINHFYFEQIEVLQAFTKGNVEETKLGDISIVTLNKNSILDYPKRFKGSKRMVKLTKGEAFLKLVRISINLF